MTGDPTVAVREWLEDVAARAEAATGGRWRLWGMQVRSGPPDDPDLEQSVAVADTYYRNTSGHPRTFDAAFIAAARTDLPAAVAALRAVLDVLDAVEPPIAGVLRGTIADELSAAGVTRG